MQSTPTQPSPPAPKQPPPPRNQRADSKTSHAVKEQPGNSCVQPPPIVSSPQVPAVAGSENVPESSAQIRSCTVRAMPEVKPAALDVDHPPQAQQIFQMLTSSAPTTPPQSSTTAGNTSMQQRQQAHVTKDGNSALDVHSNSPDKLSSKVAISRAQKKKSKQQQQHKGVGVRLCDQGNIESARGACQLQAGGMQKPASIPKANGNAHQQSSAYMSNLRAKLQSTKAARHKFDLAGVKKKKRKQ